MDRILYFRWVKGRNDIPAYSVQILRAVREGFVIYYLQVVGELADVRLADLHGEMNKALERLEARYRREEDGLRTYLVLEDGFEKWLENLGAKQYWQQLWQFPVYSDYQSNRNLKYLLQTIPRKDWPKKAMILGCGVGMQEWLPFLAEHVHNMELYVEFMTKGLEELQEELCEEYGMVTDLKLVEPGGFQRERLRSREPVLVIDFSGCGNISVLGMEPGSIWVDMDAMENKRHLIEDRPTGLTYLSLKTIWKREMIQTLDTISKFAYNTRVKIGR